MLTISYSATYPVLPNGMINSRCAGLRDALRKLNGVVASQCRAAARIASIAACARSRPSLVSARSSKQSKSRAKLASAVGNRLTTKFIGQASCAGVKPGLEFVQDSRDGNRDARPVVLLRCRLRPRMERGLDTPEGDRVSHSCFDEFGQRFAWLKHGLKLGAHLWLDARLGYDGGLHAKSLLRVGCAHIGLFVCTGSAWRPAALVDPLKTVAVTH